MLKKYILILFLVCVTSAAVAQQNPLLEKYRSMAVEYSHDLKAADKNIAASVELEKAAQKDLYPKLSGNANFQYTGNPLELTLNLPSMGDPVTFSGNELKYGAAVSLQQPVYTGGRLLETIRMARYRQNVSAFQEEYIRSGIYLQTDMQYWNTVARTEIVRISDDYRNSVASLTQTIRERVDAGLTDRQDLLMMEVKLNEAEYQLLQARKNLENGMMALNSLIGVELETPTEVEDSVAIVVVDDVSLWSGEGSVRPELKIATEQIRMAESEKKLTLSRYRPQFYVGVDVSYSSPGYNFRTDMDPNYAIYAKVSDIENGAGDVSELRRRIAELKNQLESTGQKLADLSTFGRFRRKNRDKLKLADRQLTELRDELDSLSEKRDNAQKNFHEFTAKNQEQVRMRLTDAVFARMVVDVRSLLDAMPSELKARVDGEFLTAIAERPNEILKCAMYLFLGYLDGATQFAQSCGGGGGDTSLPWGRNPDEDDRRFTYRCMMQAHKMLKPSQPRRGMSGR